MSKVRAERRLEKDTISLNDQDKGATDVRCAGRLRIHKKRWSETHWQVREQQERSHKNQKGINAGRLMRLDGGQPGSGFT